MRGNVRVRRSPHLVCYWDGPRIVLHNYFTRVQATAHPFAVVVLSLLGEARRADSVHNLLPGYSPESILETINQLRLLTFVEEVSPGLRRRERAMQLWSAWGPEASFFHWGTKDVTFVRNLRQLALLERRRLAEAPQPAFFKRYPRARRVALPHPSLDAIQPLAGVLGARRTVRKFGTDPLALDDVARLLKLTWGVSGYMSTAELGRVPLKTSPSGGARHPVEVYLAALRVRGLPPGLYHYRSDAHSLELLKSGNFAAKAGAYCGNQHWVGKAGALFFMTAVFERTMWRYRFGRALRVIYTESGHLCQTFCLVATALGLAPFCTAALADSLIERDLGLDGIRESVLYVAGVGRPFPSRVPRTGRGEALEVE